MKDFAYDLWVLFKGQILLLIGLIVLVGATEGLGLILFLPLINLLSNNPSPSNGMGGLTYQLLEFLSIKPSLSSLALIITSIFAFQAIVSIYQGKMVAQLESTYVDHWRRRLLTTMLQAKWSFFVEHKTGQLLFAFGTETEQLGRALLFMVQIVSTTILLIIYFLITIYLSWQFSCLMIFIGLFGFLVITRQLAQKAYKTGKSYSTHNSYLLGHVSEAFTAVKMIKTTHSEARVLSICGKLLNTLKRDYYGAVFYPYILRSILEFFIIIGICGSLVLLHHIGIAFASIMILMAICLRILPKLYVLQSSYQLLIGYLPSFKNLTIQLNKAILAVDEEINLSLPLLKLTGPPTIRFENVSLFHDNILILNNLNFTVEAGSICGIVGSSGAGKSSLVDLLVRITQPASGCIWINDFLISEIPISSLRRSIGYVTQETLLLHDTIRNNITWGLSQYAEEDILQACQLSNAHEFIQQLPQGYDTLVGERGNKLSGGQRQRIALARALISNPKLLILDEATSALDSESEHAIIETLHQLRGHLTILLISHRLLPIHAADQIIVLESGCIIESGSWEELAQKGGVFSNLCHAQKITIP